MKARLPKNYNPGAANIQQLARQAQKMQEEMDAATTELEEKEYSATSGGEAVTAVSYTHLSCTGNYEYQNRHHERTIISSLWIICGWLLLFRLGRCICSFLFFRY